MSAMYMHDTELSNKSFFLILSCFYSFILFHILSSFISETLYAKESNVTYKFL